MLEYSIMAEISPDDREFITAIYKEFERIMYATAYKYTSTPQIVEDIVQESILRIMQKIETIRPMEKNVLAAYIIATIRNTSINQLKKQEYNRIHIQEDAEDELRNIAADISLEELVLLSDNLERLSNVWPQLAWQDQFLLEGKYILGYTDKELAQKINCKPNSIRMKLTRARRNALSLLIKLEGADHYA